MAGLGCGSFSFNNNISSNKTYVLVKLTESAQKSLHEYLKNQKQSRPTISFNGNEGDIKIPTGNHDISTFKFQMQRAQDSEGPQGSFECIRQTNSSSVESLGPMLSILRIQAKDDSYEKTRQSMANAIALNGKTCVKELKSNGVMSRHKTRPSLVVPPQKKEASSFTSNPFLSHNGNPPSSSPHNSSGGNSQGKPGWSQSSRPHPPLPPLNGKRNVAANPGLIRRPLRERLIQLLALKSMNKLQLIQKLNSEGLKECDKKRITSELHSIAAVRENAYHLPRHLWSEVIEDWPFYTEEEKLILKRNKPQNASPPERDAMNNASQSPNSTVSLSLSPSSGGTHQEAAKRPLIDLGFDPTVKKTRFRKSEKLPDTSSRSESCSVSSSDQGWTGSGVGGNGGSSDNSESGTRHKRLQNHPYENSLHPDNHIKAPDRRAAETFPQDQYSNNSLNIMNGHCLPPGDSVSPLSQGNSPREGAGGSHRMPDSAPRVGNQNVPLSSDKRKNGFSHEKAEPRDGSSTYTQEDMEVNHVDSSSSSPDSQQEDPTFNYLEQYPRITNVEQRRRYKSNFNSIYKEYELLHTEFKEVKNYFNDLNAKLEQEGFDTPEYKRIKNNLLKEFNSCKANFRAKKKRYDNLDQVLQHIKMRVNEFDGANKI